MIGLNLGSGQRRFVSNPEINWVNIDKVDRDGDSKPDLVLNVEHLPYDDNSIDLAVSHHCYEHLGCGEALGAVREAYRVLRPGGQLLVFVPDNRKIAKAYLDGQLSDGTPFDEFQFNVNMYGAYMGDEEDRHRWSFSTASLTKLLSDAAPWKYIGRFQWGEIPGADIARDDRWILGMEALK